MPRIAADHTAVLAFDANGACTVTGDSKALAGLKLGIRPVGLSITSLPELVDKVKGKALDGAKTVSELALHKGVFDTARDAVKGLSDLSDNVDRLKALNGMKGNAKGKFDKVVAWISTTTGGKLTVDIIT